MLSLADVEAIERATLAAVPPERMEELPGWLLGLDRGTVGRAHSAAPLRHVAPGGTVVPDIEARYAQAGLPAVFRLPDLPVFKVMRADLQSRGYVAGKPTLVMVCNSKAAPPQRTAWPVQVSSAPDDAWAGVFLGEGFDPVDGASRVAILRRARAAVFARALVDGRPVAVGSACFSHGWCGIHGMRTAPDYRRRGLADAIVAALVEQARLRGMSRLYLQAEVGNTTAQSVYRRHGFLPAWSYTYWTRPAGTGLHAAAPPGAGSAACPSGARGLA